MKEERDEKDSKERKKIVTAQNMEKEKEELGPGSGTGQLT